MNSYAAASERVPVSVVKRVDLPTEGNPTVEISANMDCGLELSQKKTKQKNPNVISFLSHQVNKEWLSAIEEASLTFVIN